MRFRRKNGATIINQANKGTLTSLFADGSALLTALRAYVADVSVKEADKSRARKLIANPPTGLIAEDEERFRFQLWLDGERSSLFFADRVILVEGASEKALFNFLLANDWHDLSQHRICVVDVLGKFNFHRYMSLMRAFQIPYGVMLDDDNGKEHQQAINDLIDSLASQSDCPILAKPEKIADCLEVLLGLPKVGDRDYKKPIEIMKAVSTVGGIDPTRLLDLRDRFRRALGLP